MNKPLILLSALLLSLCLPVDAQDNPKAAQEATVVCGNARFTVLTDCLIRMEWSEDGLFEDRATFSFVNRNLPVPEFKSSRNAGRLTITTDKVVLRYSGAGSRFDASNLSVSFRMNGRKVTWKPGDDESGNLMGTARTLDRAKGGKLREGTLLEKGILSKDGWAIVDDSERHLFVPDSTHWGNWMSCRPEGERQDWYIFAYGHEYRRAMADFSKVAGRAPLPPKYVFGYWWSRYWQYSDSELRDLVGKLRTLSIPLDVLVVDMDWHETWSLTQKNPKLDEVGQRIGWTGYTWQKELFPSPSAFLEWTDRQKLPVALNLHPASGIQPYESVYDDFIKDYGWDNHGKPVPFNMDEKKWADSYFKTIIDPMEKMGVDFWWLDWQQWLISKYTPGLSNTFWLNYTFYRHAEFEHPELRPFLYHRWGGLGSHRYPLAFSGDHFIMWESLGYQPEFTATSANVNYGYWGHDLGGHMQTNPDEHTDPEMYTRWLQYGVFSPIFKTHSTKHPNVERYFWLFKDRMFTMIETVRLRYSLVPYIYNAARRNYDTGIAMCHPLYYDYPEAPDAYSHPREYMFGEDILATCICHPADSSTRLAELGMWFPKGHDWFDMAHGRMYRGGDEMTLQYTIEENPWFVKAGSVIPMYPSGIQNLKREPDTLVVQFIPGADGCLEYYEDDGVSRDYESAFSITPISQTRVGQTITATIGARRGSYSGARGARSYELHFPATAVPQSVTVNGKELCYRRFPESDCWTYDAFTLAPVVYLKDVPVDGQTVVRILLSAEGAARQQELYGLQGIFGRCRAITEEYKTRQGLNDGRKMLPKEYLAIAQCPSFVMEYPQNLFDYVDALKANIPAFAKKLDVEDLIEDDFKTVLRSQIIQY